MNNYKQYYTAADYSRYHRGEMSAAEMHALEKAALKDPFVQDALDGYALLKTGERDIASLSERIAAFQKTTASQKKTNNNIWWRVAAVAILALGIAFFIYRTSNQNLVPQTAEVNETEKNLTTAKSDSVGIAQTEDQTRKAKESDLPINDGIVTDGTGAAGEDIVIVPRRQATPVVKNIGQDIVEAKEVEKIGEKYKLAGKIVSEEGVPLADVTITSDDKKVLTKTDQAGNFELESKEKDMSAVIVNNGYQARKKTLNATQSETVVLQRNDAVQANSPNNASRKIEVNNSPSVGNAVAVPANGWEDYNKYLTDNTPIVYNEAGVMQTGMVVLNFEINKSGTPEKITVKTSDCKDCNLPAKQVLKDGPKWKGKANVENELSIKF